MPYEDKMMVASGSSEHPGEEEVSFETIPKRGGEGHTYDLEFNDGLDELTLTEDGTDKTTLPLVATFVGTHAEWNALSAAEKANYRLVNFTEDGGIGDASNAVVAFTSSDVADGNVNDWTSVTPITTGLNLKTLWERASMMFKNIRYLYKMLGTTDISSIGNGTVTGAITTLNSDLTKNNIDTVVNINTTAGTVYEIPEDGYLCLYAVANSRVYVTIKGSTNGFFDFTAASPSNSGTVIPVFLRKGMSVTVNAVSGSGSSIYYYKLI